MKLRALALLPLLALPFPALAQPPARPPAALGGAILVGWSSAPEPAVSYPLADWRSAAGRGRATVVGLMGPESVGLGVGHRFEDYKTPSGETVTFTIGPAVLLRWRGCSAGQPQAGCRGLRSARWGLFAVVAMRKPEGKGDGR